MNKQTLVLLAVIAILFIPTGVLVHSYAQEKYARLTGEGGISYCVAYLDIQKEDTKTPDIVPQTTCDKCNGTKKVKSGDGLVTVPCPCGANCKCSGMAPEGSRKPVVKILYVGAEWCMPCTQVSNFTFPKLIKSGWEIKGPNKGGHIEKFDFSLDADKLHDYKVESLPTWIKLEDDKEVSRHEGFLNAWGVSHFQTGQAIVPSDEILR